MRSDVPRAPIRNYRLYATRRDHLATRHLDAAGRAGLAGPAADRQQRHRARHHDRPPVPAVLLLSPYAGLLADRHPKRRLLLFTQAGMAAAALALGLLAVSGAAQVWHVYLLAFVFGIANAFDIPGPAVVRGRDGRHGRLGNAVRLNSASFNAARVVGPALAGGSSRCSWRRMRPAWCLPERCSYLAVIWSLNLMRTADLSTPSGRRASPA